VDCDEPAGQPVRAALRAPTDLWPDQRCCSGCAPATPPDLPMSHARSLSGHLLLLRGRTAGSLSAASRATANQHDVARPPGRRTERRTRAGRFRVIVVGDHPARPCPVLRTTCRSRPPRTSTPAVQAIQRPRP